MELLINILIGYVITGLIIGAAETFFEMRRFLWAYRNGSPDEEEEQELNDFRIAMDQIPLIAGASFTFGMIWETLRCCAIHAIFWPIRVYDFFYGEEEEEEQ